MRLAFRRSALLAAVSLFAMGTAVPTLAQSSGQDPQLPVQDAVPSEPAPPPPLIDKIQPQGEEPVPLIRLAPADEAQGEDGDEDEDMGIDEALEPEEEKTPPIPAIWSPVPHDAEGRSAFGQYLAGRFALRKGDSADAAVYLDRTKTLTPEQPGLNEQLFSAALLAGHIDKAARSVPDEDRVSPFLSQAGRLVVAAQAFGDGDARRANALLKAKPAEAPHRQAGIYFQVWVAAAAGDWERALAAPPTDIDPLSALLARGNRATLLEHNRKLDEAEAEWKDLVSHAVASRLFRLPYGQFLERRGRRDEALVQYQAAVTAGVADRRTYEAIARVQAKGRAPALKNFKAGAVQSLITAADQSSAQDAHQVALIYLRLAQAIMPSSEMTVQIGQVMRKSGLESLARTELATVPQDDPIVYGVARYQMALSYEEDKQFEAAVGELDKAIGVAPDDRGLNYSKSALLIQMKRYQEALDLLNSPVLNTPDQGFEIYFLRGAAYSWVGEKEKAEANLWHSLQLQPNNPMILNHLGYQWVDQGTRVAEGAAMIAKAFAANPNDGNIQDSLGWAQFRMGNYNESVVNLEGAVAKEPANAEINDHLGDVYWVLGRHREAMFQWARVLSLEAEPERREAVEGKLKLEPGQALPPVLPSLSAAQ